VGMKSKKSLLGMDKKKSQKTLKWLENSE